MRFSFLCMRVIYSSFGKICRREGNSCLSVFCNLSIQSKADTEANSRSVKSKQGLIGTRSTISQGGHNFLNHHGRYVFTLMNVPSMVAHGNTISAFQATIHPLRETSTIHLFSTTSDLRDQRIIFITIKA